MVDFSCRESPQGAAQVWLRNLFETPFVLDDHELFKAFVLKIDKQIYWYVGLAHHVIMDGWGFSNWARRLGRIYNGDAETETDTQTKENQWQDVVLTDQAYLSSKKYQSDKAYWSQQVFNHEKLLTPHYRYQFDEQGVIPSNREIVTLSAQQVTAVSALAKQFKLGVSHIYLGLLSSYYSKAFSKTNLTFGLPFHNRKNHQQKQMLGAFTGISPMAIHVEHGASFLDLLHGLAEQQKSNLRHQRYPLGHLIKDQGADAQERALFDVTFNYLKLNSDLEFDAQAADLVYLSHNHEVTPLKVTVWEYGDEQYTEIQLDYNRAYFHESEVQQLGQRLLTLLEQVLVQPEILIEELTIIPAAEKKLLLAKEHPLDALPDLAATKGLMTHEMFEAQAQKRPHAVALVFEGQSFSYQQLNEQANQLAHYLRGRGVTAETLVGLYLERSSYMLVSLLAILKAGGAYLPLDVNYPKRRLQYMLADSQINYLITEPELTASLEFDRDLGLVEIGSEHYHQHISGYSFENLSRLETQGPDSLAYVIYTSGSTGQPKGVMIEHGAFAHFLQAMQERLAGALSENSRLLAITTISFDIAGLELFGPLAYGGQVVLATREDLLNPQRLSQMIQSHDINVMQATPATWQSLVDNRWRGKSDLVILSGGEPLTSRLANAMLSLSARLWNCYGPTEATVWSMVHRVDGRHSVQGMETIGATLTHYNHVLLDEQQQLVPFGNIGELYIGGECLARGYFNREALTQERFFEDTGTSEGRLYRTGDLARFLPDGRLEYIGRIDEQVKINGFRIEIGEIEHQLSRCQAVASSVVLARKDDAQHQVLVAYVLVDEEGADLIGKIKDSLYASLPHYMVPAIFVLLNEWPLTPNGKVDKKALPDPDKALSQASYVPAKTATEQKLVQIWSALLKIEASTLSINSNFFELGGHSLLAMKLVAEIQKVFSRELTLKAVFDALDIQSLAKVIDQAANPALPLSLVPVERLSPQLPLSFAQQRLWFVEQMQKGSNQYNMSAALQVTGALDIDIAQQAITAIIHRHEPLRTVYHENNGTPVQIIHEVFDFRLKSYALDDFPQPGQADKVAAFIRQENQQGFDLSSDLMVRASYLALSDNTACRGVLLLSMHHIASDGWSVDIFIREFVALYQSFLQGEDAVLASLPLQYADYAVWQKEHFSGQYLQSQLLYWQQQLAQVPVVHRLPLDFPRPEQKTAVGALVSGQLPEKTSRALEALARTRQVTPFILLHAAFVLVLSRHSNSRDIVIGTPVANRMQPELDDVIGLFVNTLVLRVETGHETFSDYLDSVKKVNLQAQSNQDVPFEQLLEHCKVPRSSKHTPLVQIMFSMDKQLTRDLTLPGIEFSVMETDEQVAKFDLELSGQLTDTGLSLSWIYDVSLFSRDHIEQLNEHLLCLLTGIAATPDALLADLPMLSADELHQQIHAFNGEKSASEQDKLLYDDFQAQVSKTPDNTALVFAEQRMSYLELNQAANRLAYYLRQQGAGQGDLVGLCCERSLDMFVGILAIVKAGAAYLPLDPAYPFKRLNYTIADSGLNYLLTRAEISKGLSVPGDVDIIAFDNVWVQAQVGLCPVADPDAGMKASHDSLAYVIYTSGSTGQPKGVMVSHQAIAGHLSATIKAFNFSEQDKVLQLASFSFDTFIEQTFAGLSCGASLYVLSAQLPDTENFFALVNTNGITITDLPVAYFSQLLTNADESHWANSSLSRIVLGGEAVSSQLIRQWFKTGADGDCQLFNAYGPTEAVITSTLRAISKADQHRVSIGKVFGQRNLYVLDSQLRICPLGSEGELYIGGAELASGYLHCPELTGERFLDNIFSDVSQDKLYRTGDLVRYLDDGQLEFIGRVDDQVKIRGFRVELGEIEHQLLKCQQLSSAQVLLREDIPGQKRLVAYVIAGEETAEDTQQQAVEIKKQLQTQLPAHMVPAAIVFIKHWPLTVNGKVDKQALPAPDESVLQGEYVGAATEAEQILVDIWAQLLKIEPGKLSVTGNFFALGGDSIISIQVVSQAAHAGLHFSVKELFSAQTIRELAVLAKQQTSVLAPQQAVTGKAPLLPIQADFFADETDIHHFNQAVMLTAPAGLDITGLTAIVRKLYQRHDVLRLKFSKDQQTWSAEHLPFTEEMLTAAVAVQPWPVEGVDSLEHYATQVQQSLKPEQGQLFKAVYLPFEQGETSPGRLLLVIHHLVVDGVSWRILLQDIEQLYQQYLDKTALSLPLKSSAYKQWGEFLHQFVEGGQVQKSRDFWLSSAEPSIPLLSASAVNNRQAALPEGTGIKSLRFSLPKCHTELLITQANQTYRTQINELLLAVLMLAVKRWSGEHQLLLDLEGHGREMLTDSLDLSQTLGWFTSIYPLTLTTNEQDSIAEIICAVKEQYRATPHNGIEFGLLKHIAKDPQINALPAAQLLFNYLGQFEQGSSDSHFALAPESTGESVSAARKVTHPLTLNGMITNGCLSYALEFEQSVFSHDAMELFKDYLLQAFEEVVEHCVEVKQGLYTPSDFPHANISSDELLQWQQSHEIEKLYLATGMQVGMLFHSMFDAGNYVAQTLLHFDELNLEHFRQACHKIIENHDIFRTCFVGFETANSHQLVTKQVTLPWYVEDLSQLSAQELLDKIEDIRVSDQARGFSLTQAPLMRFTVIKLGGNSYKILWSNHHALLDGWSSALTLKEIISHYQALHENLVPAEQAVVAYQDYIAWLSRQDIEQGKNFWHQQLQAIDGLTPLPFASHRRDSELALTSKPSYQLRLSEQETSQLAALAKGSQTTVNVIFQAAWAMLLARFSGEDKVVFGATTSGRPPELAGVESMLGLFINTLPVVIDVQGEDSVNQWLQQLHHLQVERENYNYLPLFEIQQLAPVDQGLFDSLLIFENYPLDDKFIEQIGLNKSDIVTYDGTNYALNLVAHLDSVLSIDFESEQQYLSQSQLVAIATYLKQLLMNLAASPQKRLCDISMLPAEEADRLICQFNDNKQDFPQDKLLHELFEDHVQSVPDNIAAMFDGEQLSYRALNEAANQLAHYLIEKGVTTDTFVGIYVDKSFEMIISMLAILKAGGAYVPLDPSYPSSRLQYIVSDTGVQYLLTQSALASDLDLSQCHEVISLDQANLSEVITQYPTTNPGRQAQQSPESLAYIIYTSGSTGQPKGVMIEHNSVCNLLIAEQAIFDVTSQSRVLQFAIFAFDAATAEIFMALANGASLYLPGKDEIQAGIPLMDTLQHKGITHVTLPGSVLALCDIERPLSLQALIVAGEACPAPLARLWRSRYRFFNAYGPSETTVCATTHEYIELEGHSVPIGKALANTQVYILDQHAQVVPVGVAGEIYVAGAGVARGYLNQKALTEERFLANPFVDDAGARMYKTGDVGRWLEGGIVDYLGRNDSQIKLRGFRIELGEIEEKLQLCPGINEALVIADDEGGQYSRLIAYVVDDEQKTNTASGLRTQLADVLPGYMVPAAFVILPEFPLTENGKIDRKQLPTPDQFCFDGEYLAPQTQTEKVMLDIWASLLQLTPESISITANFFELGGHSLLAVRLNAQIRSIFHQEVPIKTIFSTPDIQGLAGIVDGGSDLELKTAITPVSRDEKYLPLSYSQRRLWLIDRMLGASPQYNMAVALKVEGDFNLPAAEQAIGLIIERHEPLRTVFAEHQQQPMQVIKEAVEFKLHSEDLNGLSQEEGQAYLDQRIIEDNNKAFDLSQDLMVRAAYFRLALQDNVQQGVLLFNIHHIASDGWSLSILANEFMKQYQAAIENQTATLPALAVQYADYAHWQNAWLDTPKVRGQFDYWQHQLANAPTVHQLPLDQTRKPKQVHSGKVVTGQLPHKISLDLKSVANAHNMTPFMILHAVLSQVLARHSNQQDIVIGTPVANRTLSEVEALIGFFVNTLVLRVNTEHNDWQAYLEHVKAVNLAAQEHQDVPFEQLVEHLNLPRNSLISPLFQIMFSMNTNESFSLQLPGVQFSPIEPDSVIARFDLDISAQITENGIEMVWVYDDALFSQARIEQLNAHFLRQLEGLVDLMSSSPQHLSSQVLASVPMLSEAEQHQLLSQFNSKQLAYPREQKIQQLFEAQAQRNPDALALSCGELELTYRQLNQQANQLARCLQAQGVQNGDLIGVSLSRTPLMVVAVMAIFKAGAAYVALDPGYPDARLQFMVNDSGIKLLLTEQAAVTSLTVENTLLLDQDDSWQKYPKTDLDLDNTGQQLAYVIYTSGSTGQPKGVMINHQSVLALLYWAKASYGEAELQRVLASTSLNFDLSVFELFVPLSFGYQCVLVNDVLSLLNHPLEVSLINTVPSAVSALLSADAKIPGVKVINLAGEPLSATIVNDLLGKGLCEKVVNLYGPSEDTTYSTWAEFNQAIDTAPAIGQVLANSQAYVLSDQQALLPVGSIGELYLGGDGVSQGYLHRPELNAERFIDNPFAPGKLYRTGDLVQYRSDGQLLFAGRIDDQVKIRGFRIEIGEIEHRLSQSQYVANSVVLAREDSLGQQQLSAYFVPQSGAQALSDEQLLVEIKQELAQYLPDYMVPTILISLAELPLTPNGKIDKKALVLSHGKLASAAYVAPVTETEGQMTRIWVHLLQLETEKISTGANFFELGGHSLLAVRMTTEIVEHWDIKITVTEVFNHPSLQQLSAFIDAELAYHYITKNESSAEILSEGTL